MSLPLPHLKLQMRSAPSRVVQVVGGWRERDARQPPRPTSSFIKLQSTTSNFRAGLQAKQIENRKKLQKSKKPTRKKEESEEKTPPKIHLVSRES